MQTLSNVFKITFFSAVLAISFAVVATPALAFTPTLSVSSLSNNSVTLTVSGDANSTVQLYSQYSYVAALGVTNSSGYLYATVSATSYNISSGASVYVVVNGQQSSAVIWPSTGSVYCPLNYQTGTSYQQYQNQYQNCPPLPIVPPPYVPPVVTPPISTGSLSVGVNQTSTVYGQGNGPYTVTSNSNPNVVSATASGNTITFTGRQIGSASIMVCPNNGYNNYQYPYSGIYNGGTYNNSYNYNYTGGYGYNNAPCASFVITVIPAISFSQSNVTLYGLGASQSISLSGGSYNNYYQYNPYNSGYYNSYFVTNNTNPGTVSANVNGNSLVVYGVGYGGSTITVCSTSGACGTVYVSVNGSTNYGYPTYYQPYSYNYTQPSYVAPSQNYYRAPTPISGGWYRRW